MIAFAMVIDQTSGMSPRAAMQSNADRSDDQSSRPKGERHHIAVLQPGQQQQEASDNRREHREQEE